MTTGSSFASTDAPSGSGQSYKYFNDVNYDIS